MREYKSLSGAGNFLVEIQEKSWKGEIHSTFRRTINIVSESGELYTIAATELDNAPNTLRVTELFNIQPKLSIKTPVYSQNGQLVIGKILAISTQDASKWHYPQIEFPQKAEYVGVIRRVEEVKKWLKQVENNGGYLLNKNQANIYEKMIHTMLWQESKQLLLYLKEKQLFQAKQQLNRVIGLGPGLTPSGDDFLVGLALIFATVDYPYHSLRQWLINNRNELKKRTNSISFSTLDWAIKGVARERIGLFLNELFYGEEKLRQRMQDVLEIGSTSGADLLTGMIAGIELTLGLD